MNSLNRNRLSTLALSVALAVGAAPAIAQNTSSAVGGRVLAADGKPAAGAQVKIVHVESGSQSDVVTDADGRYSARGLRVGGPYTITISKGGISEKRENVFLQLADVATVDAKLGGTQALDTVVVTGSSLASDKFSPTAMGASTSIGRAELEGLASISGSLQDYARIDPRLSQTDKERGEISAAGQNSRYNTVTIDSQSISDTFGLEANTLPTLRQPISIDAIQTVQVNVSNYDVTQKGYTGANINAVTKSGTNAFKGSIYYKTRDEKFVGDRYIRATDTYTAAPAFDQRLFGVTFGGPIIKDRLFFFMNYEDAQWTPGPNLFTVGPLGSGLPTEIGISQTAITNAAALALSRYSINAGTAAAGSPELTSKEALLKLDWNIASGHRASVRFNKTQQNEPFFPTFFDTPTYAMSLSSHWFSQAKNIKTAVGQWFADWSPTFSTEVKISSRDFDSLPANTVRTPQIILQYSGALPVGVATTNTATTGNRNLVFGTERSRHYNALITKTTDAYAGATWALGEHELKFGWDYSKNVISNAFVQDANGNYTFNCQNSSATYTYTFGPITCNTATAAQVEAAVLENFNRGRPSTYAVQVALPGFTLEDARGKMTLNNSGVFLQDTWSFSPQLTLMAGVRLDMPTVGNRPIYNPTVASPMVAGVAATTTRQTGGFGRDNRVTIDGENLFQPRVGFNYTFEGKKQMQLRGGAGLFQGAAANVWMINPYQNNGMVLRTVGCGGAFAACPAAGGVFSADPATQPVNFAGAAPAASVDLIEQGLGQPAVWKANIAFERELTSSGLVFGAEYLQTKTQSGIYFQHLNLGAATRTSTTDGREMYYTPQGYDGACWTATGTSISTGTCTGFRNRALSNASFANVVMAAKTSKGFSGVASLSLSRPTKAGFGWSASYTRTAAEEVSPLTSSVSISNFRSRATVNANDDSLGNSAYLVKDRFAGTMNWEKTFFGNLKTSFGVFYEGRSGKPYSWTFANDINGDSFLGNDLMYIPRAPGSGEVIFRGDTATDKTNENRFWDFVNSNPELYDARGSIVKRNSSFAPWTNSFDLRISQQLPTFVKGHRASLTLDVLNFSNMLNKKWGRINEIAFNTDGGQRRSFASFAGLDAQGRYIYAVGTAVTDYSTRQRSGESQWALQVTARYEF